MAGVMQSDRGPDSVPAETRSLTSVLSSAIEALRGNDQAQLERILISLVAATGQPRLASPKSIPGSCRDSFQGSFPDARSREAQTLHHLLGALLEATERNLRLWRRVLGLGGGNVYANVCR